MFYICIQYLHDERGRRTHPAHQPESSRKAPGGGSWFGRHEGRSDTVGGARGRPESSKEARETGDVKTGREGTAGRAKARKGDWAATWVPRQARNKTRDNNFRIPPPAHDVGGKDAEASRLSRARQGAARLGAARQGKARQRSYERDSG